MKAHATTEDVNSYMRHAVRRSPVSRLRNSTWIKEGKNLWLIDLHISTDENLLPTRCDCANQLTHDAFLKTHNLRCEGGFTKGNSLTIFLF